MITSTTTFTSNQQPMAEAFISKSKNRLKQNGTTVYLNDKDNFEIEVFNPRTAPVLFKIKINGKYISDTGLVLMPGMRYFLDRHITEARKFQFKTYEIDANDSAAAAAVVKNGMVEIEFFDESITVKIEPNFKTRGFTNISGSVNSFFTNTGGYVNTTLTNDSPIIRSSNYSSKMGGEFGDSATTMDWLCQDMDRTVCDSAPDTMQRSYFSSQNNTKKSFIDASNLRSKSSQLKASLSKTETGRIEKGEKSDQEFGKSDLKFNPLSTNTVTWYIKPASTQPIEVTDLVNYCTFCGKKLKQTDRFCSACGTKVSE